MEENNIKIGRDAFFELLRVNNLLVKNKRTKVKTTNSRHKLNKYPNLIKDFVVTRANQLWVNDITYIPIENGYAYLSLTIDAYSRKILSYKVSETLESKHTLEVLKKAIKDLKKTKTPIDLIHHSDRGSQYCEHKYINKLKENGIKISMTENGDPRQNAIAERVNGILKEEYLNFYQIKDIEQAKKIVSKVIKIYNEQRPHNSINNEVPSLVHSNRQIKVKKLWKTYYKKDKKHKTDDKNQLVISEDNSNTLELSD